MLETMYEIQMQSAFEVVRVGFLLSMIPESYHFICRLNEIDNFIEHLQALHAQLGPPYDTIVTSFPRKFVSVASLMHNLDDADLVERYFTFAVAYTDAYNMYAKLTVLSHRIEAISHLIPADVNLWFEFDHGRAKKTALFALKHLNELGEAMKQLDPNFAHINMKFHG